jgi:hypothetical protein
MNKETMGMKVTKFIVNNLEVYNSGQGIFAMDCKKLWEMPDEEFEKLFLKEGK